MAFITLPVDEEQMTQQSLSNCHVVAAHLKIVLNREGGVVLCLTTLRPCLYNRYDKVLHIYIARRFQTLNYILTWPKSTLAHDEGYYCSSYASCVGLTAWEMGRLQAPHRLPNAVPTEYLHYLSVFTPQFASFLQYIIVVIQLSPQSGTSYIDPY
jgi:hypothetical protein